MPSFTAILAIWSDFSGLEAPSSIPGRDNELIDIFSNFVAINVNKPQGENIETLKLLSAARKYNEQKQLSLIYFDKIINEYPNSVHRERALLIAGYVYRYSHDDSLSNISIERYGKLVNEYPNSNYCKQALAEIFIQYRSMDNRNDGINFLEKLVSAHPNTKAGNKAQEMLNKAMNIPEDKWDFRKQVRKRRENSN
ncbi:MAG: outer membrane protein assembly factor BamD, partial [FCB group bacterium]|nr:outer membrane protein assembly factor BamD [FCB group bacterium]